MIESGGDRGSGPAEVKSDQMYNFTVENIRLSKADLTHTFDGTSLGYKAVIYFQQKQVMETSRREVSGDSISWDEGFEMYSFSHPTHETRVIPLGCGLLEVKLYEDLVPSSDPRGCVVSFRPTHGVERQIRRDRPRRPVPRGALC